jgi:F-type H+-transporting ATPase subunit b
MPAFVLILQEAAAKAESVNWLSVALSWLNFGVLVFILIRFGGPIIRDMLKNRHLTIKKNLDEARALREQAEKRLVEYEGRLANIEREIAEIMAGIRREADAEAARIVAAAQEGAHRMRKDAEFAISQEGRRLEIELRREAAELAIDAARKLLSGKMTEADHRKLAETFVREMAGG